jgi:hypothetical protein
MVASAEAGTLSPSGPAPSPHLRSRPGSVGLAGAGAIRRGLLAATLRGDAKPSIKIEG